MKPSDEFEAARDGEFDLFLKFYDGNANEVSPNHGLSALYMALLNEKNPSAKLKIIDILLRDGANPNLSDPKYRRNALHTFFFNVLRPTEEYLQTITERLCAAGADATATDKFGAMPMHYLITLSKLPNEQILGTLSILLYSGADPRLADGNGKSCIEYAREFSWRNALVPALEVTGH